MKLNKKPLSVSNHHGVVAQNISPIQQLRRTVASCLLWEDGFYEDGKTIADRIKDLVSKCNFKDVAELAIKARNEYKLRHVPLLLVREMARNVKNVNKFIDASKINTSSTETITPYGEIELQRLSDVLAEVIQRPDELTEFLAIYWKDGKQPLSKQVKKGLAKAFNKFNEYQLAKYNRQAAIKLKDVLFLCHAKPKDDEQDALWKRLINDELVPADTWEQRLSGGENKKETFEDLLRNNKLGYMALLRNLRNMQQAGVNTDLVFPALYAGAKGSKALPFRFISAARNVPQWESQIDKAMRLALYGSEKLSGSTAVLIDTSGSMDLALSTKSDLNRLDAAKALAILLRGICDDVRIFTFTEKTKEIPARNGMALADAIGSARGATLLGAAVKYVEKEAPNVDRLIVFTDEESQDSVPAPHCKGYMINVATSQYGVAGGEWNRINGFSESVIEYIKELEKAS